ncbi:MAG TPA: hypothetical protein PKD00_00655 [Burkholderiales bacterium]|nr:hypothetical protein [Burkholderiales bacterium]
MTPLRSWNKEQLEGLENEIKDAKNNAELEEIKDKILSWQILKWLLLATVVFCLFYFIFKIDLTSEVIETSRLDEYYETVIQDASFTADSVVSRYSLIVSDTLQKKNIGFRIVINFK